MTLPSAPGTSLRRPLRLGAIRSVTLAALAALALVLPAAAQAQDLQTDGSDPNAAPPPPPPMPSAGQPGSATPPPPPGSTQARLQESTDRDTGVGLHFVYLQPEIGIGTASLGTVLPDKDYRSGTGAVLGVGAGFEFIAFQLGARLRYMPTPNFNLMTVGGEFAYQPGSGRFWPRIGLGVGWASANGFKETMCSTWCGAVDVKGVDVSLRAGAQYYVSPHWEIGGDFSLDALFLKRSGINVVDTSYAKDESSTGVAAAVVAHVGYHYP